jgi:hypothetical protein
MLPRVQHAPALLHYHHLAGMLPAVVRLHAASFSRQPHAHRTSFDLHMCAADVTVAPVVKGENIHQEAVRARLAALQPQALVVADLGSRAGPVLPGVPTLLVDHHQPEGFPDGAVVCCMALLAVDVLHGTTGSGCAAWHYWQWMCCMALLAVDVLHGTTGSGCGPVADTSMMAVVASHTPSGDDHGCKLGARAAV